MEASADGQDPRGKDLAPPKVEEGEAAFTVTATDFYNG
jgi:hypothetical protein